MAALIFTPFVAYAYLSRAVYRTSALVRVKPAGGTKIQLPPPLEASRRLRDAVLDAELIERLARDKSPATVAEAQQLRVDFELDTIDSLSFSVSFRGSDPARARDVCNQLARRAVKAAPQALTTPVDEESERSQRVDELMAFLSSHVDASAPGASASAVAVNSAAAREELQRNTLRAERARLAEKLEAASAPGSDNPYAEQQAAPDLLKRRIAEIDRLLAARPKNEHAPSGSASEIEAKWKTLVQAVSEAGDRAPASNVVALQASLVSEAPLPSSPVEPNRKLILLIGFLTSLGSAGLVVIGRASVRTSEARRTRRRRQDTPFVDDRGWKSPQTRSVPPEANSPPQQAFEPTLIADPLMPTVSDMGGTQVIVPQGVIEVRGSQEGRGGTGPLPEPPAEEPAPLTVPLVSPLPEPNGAEPAMVQGRPMRARGRVTQVLGSPIITEGVTLPNAQGSSYPPPPEPPAGAYNHSSVPPAGYEAPPQPRRTSSGPPRPSARISPLDVSARFRPDPSLVPANRRVLRDHLLPFSRQTGFVVAVVGSDESADVKSRVAAELSLSLAGPDQARLLLVDCDFQAPRVQQLMRVEVPLTAGFSLQLQTRVRDPADNSWTVLHCGKSLDLLAEGVIRAPDASVSPELAACITSIRYHYDFVILDGPLLSQREACRALDEVSDALVTVSRRDEGSLGREMADLFSPKALWRVEAG